MLFHATMMHTEDNCPGYERERMPEVLSAFENLESLAKDLSVKLHSFVWCPPDHVAYVLIEADALNVVSRFLFSIPIRQEMRIVPVEPIQDTIAMGKAMMAEAQGR
ncbi:MAG: hypothetical protein ACE5HZ_05770 [Fidelibacterota bacterium]